MSYLKCCSRSNATILGIWTVAAWAVIATFGHSIGAENRAAIAFYEQLHHRQLFRLAESYCRQQLERNPSEITVALRSEWVRRLLDSLTMQAINSVKLSNEMSWDNITKARDRYRADFHDPIALGRIEFQFQLAQLWRATWQRSIAWSTPNPEEANAAAAQRFQQVTRALQDIESSLNKNRSNGQTTDDPLARQQLRNQVRFKLAETFVRRSAAHPTGSPDQIYLVTQALENYTAVARLTPQSEITLESRLGEIECQQLLGNLHVAEQRLKQFPVADVDDTMRRKHIIRTAAWLVASNEPAKAAGLLTRDLANSAHDESRDLRGETQLMLIRAYVAAARRESHAPNTMQAPSEASDPADQWRSLAVELLNTMQESQSAYWIRKAEAIVSTQPASQYAESDLDLMAKIANNHFHRQEYKQAVVKFRSAAQQARELGQTDRAFDLSFQAAAVLHESQQYQQAIDAFGQLATSQREHTRAAKANWIAVVDAASLARRDAAALSQYESLLEAHVQNWPAHDTTASARLWLAQLRRQQGQFEDAIAVLQPMTPGNQQYLQALREMRRSYLHLVNDENGLTSQAKLTIARSAVDQFQLRARQSNEGDSINAAWQCEAAIAAAEFALLFTRQDPRQAVQLIVASELAGKCKQHDPNRVTALHGLAVALTPDANAGEQVRSIWNTVRWASTDWVLPLLNRLESSAADRSDKRQAQFLTTLELELIDRLDNVPELRGNTQIQRLRAMGMVRIEQRSEAIKILESLVERNPRDVTLHHTLAMLWESIDNEDGLKQSLSYWRSMARHSGDGSPEWFTAKLGIARVLISLGDTQRAQASIRLLQALHPSLGGDQRKLQFLELLKQTD